MPGPCPTPERLAAALRGRQPGGGDAELAAHLAECPDCQAKLESLAGGSSWLEAKARTHQTVASNTFGPLERAMHALESVAGDVHPDKSTPPNLDFLQSASQPGVLGRFVNYEVVAHIASGGMGIVLKARDPALNRIVALKILQPALATNSLARARFVREARAAAAVVHEHVVPIYAVEECGGLPYIVMQFVEGRTLAERIRAAGPLRLEEILRIGAQTAAGLAAAHAQGLIHRDVKPGNILLENSVERVKLTDFGLARAVDDAGLTRTGELAGTPEFMAPEQAGNETVDHRADLFSLGSVLYAMSTGISPFQGNTVVAVIRKVCDAQPPPVREVNPALPHWLSDLIAKLMAKAPLERFQTAQEVADLLERYLAGVQQGELAELPGISKRPSATRAPLRMAIAGAAGLAIVALLFFTLKHRRAATSPTPAVTSLKGTFRVRDPAGTNVRAYSSLAEAIREAEPGAVVEVATNGNVEMEPLLVSHALTLRPAPACRPMLVRREGARPMLTTKAPLVIEGMTLRDASTTRSADGAQNAGRAGGPAFASMLVVEETTLFLANCRIIMLTQPGPGAVEQHGDSRCEMRNCELYAPETTGLNIRSAIGSGENRRCVVALRNCVCFAKRALVGTFDPRAEGTFDLERNTFAGGVLFNWFPLPTRRFAITTISNLFDIESVMNRRGRGMNRPASATQLGPSRAADVLGWSEQGNFYSVQSFSIVNLDGTQTEPEFKDLAAWLAYWQASGNARAGKALVWSRVKAHQSNLDALTPNDFRLEGIQADNGSNVNGVGADLDLVGPGEAYERWRKTPGYAEWTRLVHEAVASP